MNRREFITLVGGAAAWPLAAHAQQTMPAIGFLASQLPDAITDRLRGFRQGLKDTGYVEGENVAIVYRFAENQDDRLPVLAAELVSRRIAVIVTGNAPTTFAATAATTTIPIVFLVGDDPVRLGIVTSFSRPSGNMTGINILTSELAAKRLELLRELVPRESQPEEGWRLRQHCFRRMDIAAPMKSSCDLQPDDAQMRETPKTQQNFLEAAMPALSHGGARELIIFRAEGFEVE